MRMHSPERPGSGGLRGRVRARAISPPQGPERGPWSLPSAIREARPVRRPRALAVPITSLPSAARGAATGFAPGSGLGEAFTSDPAPVSSPAAPQQGRRVYKAELGASGGAEAAPPAVAGIAHLDGVEAGGGAAAGPGRKRGRGHLAAAPADAPVPARRAGAAAPLDRGPAAQGAPAAAAVRAPPPPDAGHAASPARPLLEEGQIDEEAPPGRHGAERRGSAEAEGRAGAKRRQAAPVSPAAPSVRSARGPGAALGPGRDRAAALDQGGARAAALDQEVFLFARAVAPDRSEAAVREAAFQRVASACRAARLPSVQVAMHACQACSRKQRAVEGWPAVSLAHPDACAQVETWIIIYWERPALLRWGPIHEFLQPGRV